MTVPDNTAPRTEALGCPIEIGNTAKRDPFGLMN